MSASWAYYLDRQDDSVSERTLRRAVELGVTHFDTATLYGRGHNETLVGRALRDRPPGVLIASKCGLENRGFPRRRTRRDGRPETIRRHCDASLARLGIGRWTSTTCTASIPTCPSRRASVRSRSSCRGKVRHLGMSECTVEELARAHATHPVSALQSEFSLWTREPLRDVIPWCGDNGVSFVAFGVLGRGFLTGALPVGQEFPRATSARGTRASSRRRCAPTPSSSTACGASPSVSAQHRRRSAWRGCWRRASTCCHPGHQAPAYLEENLGGASLSLDAEALATLDALPPAVGARYP